MVTKYQLQIWDSKAKRYYKIWEGPEHWAEKMFDKSYNKRFTRRLVKIMEEVLYQEKGKS